MAELSSLIEAVLSVVISKLRSRQIYVPHADLHMSEQDRVTAISQVIVQDEGTTVGTRSTLNFQGAAVTASDDPTNNRINIAISGGTGSAHVIKENGTALPQRSGLNFVSGLVASDDSANDETDVNVDYGGAADIAAVSTAASAGTSARVPRADHVHAHGTGYLPDAHHAQAHSHNGTDGSGTVSHASLTGVAADQHHAANLSGLAANRPATAQPCTLYLATDTQELSVFI